MILYSKVTEAPANEPITLSEAKVWLKVDGTEEDALITALIVAVRRICENYAGLSFVTQKRVVKLDRFPYVAPLYGVLQYGLSSGFYSRHHIILPYGPVKSVTEFSYTDTNGDLQTLIEGTDFTVDLHSDLCRVYPISSWPTAKLIDNAVSITYNTGFNNDPNSVVLLQDRVPQEIKQAMLMQLTSLYENRQDEVSGGAELINWSSRAILDTVKVYWNANY